ncbi:MAG: Uma2 family endonuclease [Nocardioidaceae bacterium]|nr:Uma2 family endonuclease [Nocardioidaceae bacterium]MCL2612069.1 Uma2 family endonuclease [Nocardioidaceae bacterium]
MTAPAAPKTRADLDAMPDDGNRYELIEGEIVMAPAPRFGHQVAVTRLSILLGNVCPPEWEVLVAPFDVELEPDRSVVEPDIVVVDPEKCDDRGLYGSPLLAVEVLSPSTRSRDLLRKKALYERTGVPSYWVVDTADDQVSLTAWELRDGRYEAVAAVAGDEEWSAALPFEVTVVPARLAR